MVLPPSLSNSHYRKVDCLTFFRANVFLPKSLLSTPLFRTLRTFWSHLKTFNFKLPFTSQVTSDYLSPMDEQQKNQLSISGKFSPAVLFSTTCLSTISRTSSDPSIFHFDLLPFQRFAQPSRSCRPKNCTILGSQKTENARIQRAYVIFPHTG